MQVLLLSQEHIDINRSLDIATLSVVKKTKEINEESNVVRLNHTL